MILLVILAVVFGAVLGSFACCQVWRLRYQQKGKKSPGKWSVCLHCGKKLEWYDNIPVVSWLVLKGKCRKCGKKIGYMEIITEVGMAATFGLLAGYFSTGVLAGDGRAIAEMLIMMVLAVIMWMLALYDSKWGELPTALLTTAVAVAAAYRGVAGVGNWGSLLLSVLILAGVYLVLYVTSREKLVGAGDWILCLAIALVVGDWWLALIVLFLANLLGSLVMLPWAVKQKKHQIHFAPFLVVAGFAVFLLQDLLAKLISF